MVKKTVLFLIFISAILYASGGSEITPHKKIKVDVIEPSGLAFSDREDCFLTVSDEDSCVYKLNRKGKVIGKIKIDGYDLEGIAADADGNIYVVDEAYSEVISVDAEGNEFSRFPINIGNSRNKGPEGICIDKDEKLIYVVNEKNPGLILVYDFYGNKKNEYIPGLASDYSSIFYHSESGMFYILSDEESSVYIWHPLSGLSEKYKIKVNNPEGIVVGNNMEVYIISDKEQKLYVFKPLTKVVK